MTTLSLDDLRRDEAIQREHAPTLSSIEVNTCLAQLFHDNTPLTLELAERFANERWPENRERAYDRRGK